MKHVLRILTILSTTSFWLVSLHYYGPKAALYTGAAWMFALSVKDLSFLRIRFPAVADPDRRRRAVLTTAGIELGLLAIRLGLFAALILVLARYSAPTATAVFTLSGCAFLWMREPLLALMRAYRVQGATTYISFCRSFGGIALLVLLAELDYPAEAAVAGAILGREAIAFTGHVVATLAGRMGYETRTEGFDDEEGVEANAPRDIDGAEIAGTANVLIADNLVWSRWRWIQFTTRHLASGLFGPFGNVFTRIVFAYRKPGAYVHGARRVPNWMVIAGILFGTAFLSGVFFVARAYGALPALGITVAGFLSRLIALSANAMGWREMGRLIGVDPDSNRLAGLIHRPGKPAGDLPR